MGARHCGAASAQFVIDDGPPHTQAGGQVLAHLAHRLAGDAAAPIGHRSVVHLHKTRARQIRERHDCQWKKRRELQDGREWGRQIGRRWRPYSESPRWPWQRPHLHGRANSLGEN